VLTHFPASTTANRPRGSRERSKKVERCGMVESRSEGVVLQSGYELIWVLHTVIQSVHSTSTVPMHY